MATSATRNFLLLRKRSSNAIIKKALLAPAVVGCQLQVANLTSTRLHPIQRKKPWDYKKWGYNYFTQYIDNTRKRLNDNSKVIVIEGNVGVGKTEFAKMIAEEFDMKYFPDVQIEEVFRARSGFDVREFDEQLPWNLKCFDLEKFLTVDPKKNPKKVLPMSRTQLEMYEHRFIRYCDAHAHLLNTGQGVVMDRSVFGEVAIIDALRKFGYFSKTGHDYYHELRKFSICELWKPHLVVYLDAPVSMVMDNIKKRNNPLEVNSPILKEDFLQAIEDNYKKNFLPEIRKYSEVLTYDLKEMPEKEILIEDLEELDLDEPPIAEYDEEDRFKDWHHEQNYDFDVYRMSVTNADAMVSRLFSIPIPFEAPELMIQGDDYLVWKNIVGEHPEVKYEKGYNPEKYNTLLKW